MRARARLPRKAAPGATPTCRLLITLVMQSSVRSPAISPQSAGRNPEPGPRTLAQLPPHKNGHRRSGLARRASHHVSTAAAQRAPTGYRDAAHAAHACAGSSEKRPPPAPGDARAGGSAAAWQPPFGERKHCAIVGPRRRRRRRRRHASSPRSPSSSSSSSSGHRRGHRRFRRSRPTSDCSTMATGPSGQTNEGMLDGQVLADLDETGGGRVQPGRGGH
eukprot:355110-Chlamydomonas_euryale.AAC.1